MKFLLPLATAFILPLAASPVAGEGSDLKPDPKALFGSMDNGFNYIIYPNAEPPGKFSVRLHIAAGSLMEADDQRGLAHFLEHMVFNGTKNFTPAELIPKMQRLGIQFGAHANAYTSFDETVYMLDLPNLDEETMDLTFTVMRDFADGALLTEEEIDKERGVIISEKTSRDSVAYRMMVKQFEYLLPGSRLMQRVPIGTEEVINGAKRERFTDFYTRFYTPERMTFIVVGDIDPQKMEKRIRETFISLQNPVNPGVTPTKDTPPAGHGLRSTVFTDEEVPAASLALYSLKSYQTKTDTSAERIAQYPLSIANTIINRRFEVLSKEEGSPILGGNAGRIVLFNQIEQGTIAVTPTEGKWKQALPVLEQELRRAVKFGFTEDELSEAKARIINNAEEAVKRKATRRSPGISMSFVAAIGKQNVFTTPEADLALVRKALEEITVAHCQKAFNEFWDADDLSLILTTREAPEGTEEEVKNIFLKSQETEVTAPSEEKLAPFAYTDFGKPGTIVKETTIEDLDATQLILSNKIRVNYKKTDFQKNSISIRARFGSGKLSQAEENPGINSFASAILEAGGLGKHSADDLERIFAGRNVGIGFQITEADFLLSGRTTPDDLELQLQLMCAYLTDSAFRSEGERMFKLALPILYKQLKHSMQGAMIDVARHLYGGDSRFVFPEQEKALSYTSEMVKDWLMPSFLAAPLELTLVGDLDPELAIPLILKTFGALPERNMPTPDYSKRRQINIPSGPSSKKFTFDSKIPSASAMVAWQIPGTGTDMKPARRFKLLASILNDRLREEIREKLGGSYSPRAAASPNQELNMGILQALVQIKPEESEKYGKLVIEIADKIATDGITQDELERALKPIESSLKESLRNNGYWLGTVLSKSQEEPHRLDWARSRAEDYANVTVEDLNALAKEYLTKEKSLLYEIIPESKSEKE